MPITQAGVEAALRERLGATELVGLPPPSLTFSRPTPSRLLSALLPRLAASSSLAALPAQCHLELPAHGLEGSRRAFCRSGADRNAATCMPARRLAARASLTSHPAAFESSRVPWAIALELTNNFRLAHTFCSCGTSFEVAIVSPAFEGQTLLKRHRLINDALKVEMADIHALSIRRALTPQQWADEASKGQR
eukprot:SM000042S15409  [mRNA]  locus=s42:690314:691316:- [translate_table: standard]